MDFYELTDDELEQRIEYINGRLETLQRVAEEKREEAEKADRDAQWMADWLEEGIREQQLRMRENGEEPEVVGHQPQIDSALI